MEFESYFDTIVRVNGSSQSITIPISTGEKLGLRIGDIIEVGIRRFKPKDTKVEKGVKNES